ncbi:MAG TPA: tRNA dihydrouridine(20/20a) synthase DusA [Spongiibacteraceae bacterium]|nr:tRNA dihydrouridine(20/20a) synthase DusA [Spongiibacteraceae bacterium]
MTFAPVPDNRFCIAPMMDWSDRHCRYFWRLLSEHALLYTEMVTTGALLRGDAERFLHYDASEHPLALQLGGSDAKELAACARLAQQWGYDEVNLNCGCPSDRVQNGAFGACLMAQPDLVADCIKAMQDASSVPVTIKHRIGIDDMDSYEHMAHFVDTVAATGCTTFIVHARKAWLKGLSPKENRQLPPLRYAEVYRLKREFPHLNIIINGGIHTLAECDQHLQQVDGVMLGRAAYHDPYLLSAVDRQLFDAKAPIKTRAAVIEELLPYIEQQMQRGATLHHITRHILGLYQGEPGARRFRRILGEGAPRPGATVDVLMAAQAALLPAEQAALSAVINSSS